jgi:hypothetical protein
VFVKEVSGDRFCMFSNKKLYINACVREGSLGRLILYEGCLGRTVVVLFLIAI